MIGNDKWVDAAFGEVGHGADEVPPVADHPPGADDVAGGDLVAGGFGLPVDTKRSDGVRLRLGVRPAGEPVVDVIAGDLGESHAVLGRDPGEAAMAVTFAAHASARPSTVSGGLDGGVGLLRSRSSRVAYLRSCSGLSLSPGSAKRLGASRLFS